jgi:hypothetical protein
LTSVVSKFPNNNKHIINIEQRILKDETIFERYISS